MGESVSDAGSIRPNLAAALSPDMLTPDILAPDILAWVMLDRDLSDYYRKGSGENRNATPCRLAANGL